MYDYQAGKETHHACLNVGAVQILKVVTLLQSHFTVYSTNYPSLFAPCSVIPLMFWFPAFENVLDSIH